MQKPRDTRTTKVDGFWIGFSVAVIGYTIGNLILSFWWPAAGILGRCVR